ncbi:MAG TPA: protein kinase [Gemmatimonadaceae bacterium]|nr:protein kinase [Gemmatimonadaceae bacterium]
MIDLHDDLAAALAHRYEVERELGHGGMAIVYLARDVKHSRRVAVKVLRPDLASSIGAERFLREISVAAGLTHPNILSLHDSGAAEGLLYYVMPFIEGETLRARLDREHQLPIDEALAIARQVGAALDYAHAHGVVHRDIKPENILIAGEHVCVADFGLARALYTASTQRLTESAVAVGTPAYMSPEQAAADPEVDGRADIYSLACVIYEMIVGTPPFRGATAQALLAQHLTASAPSICAQRANCPPALDAAVRRALEKVPADRFRTARDFIAALSAAPTPATLPAAAVATSPARSRRARILGIAAGIAVVAGGTGIAIAKGWHERDVQLDPATFAVLPFTTRGGAADTSVLADRIGDALGEWQGVKVRRLPHASGSSERLNLGDALEQARTLGASRAIGGTTSRQGDSVEVRLTVYDLAARDEGRHWPPIVLPAGVAPPRSTLRRVANAMLRDGAELPWRDDADASQPSWTAWLAYDSARRALAHWDLAVASRKLHDATAADAAHAQAQLWLGLTEMWSGQPVSVWRPAAKRAADLRARLGTRDSLLAVAQLALADGRFPDACDLYRRYIPLDSTGIIGWFGLGECQSRDSAVVRDPSSRTRYRFRSSLESAVRAYSHAIAEGSAVRPAFLYSRLSDNLFTAGNRYRSGVAIDGSGARFAAYPSLDHDTVAFVPQPRDPFMRGQRDPAVVGKALAIEFNRARVRRLYEDWADDAPSSVDAHVALATLLEATEELSGANGEELSALREIRRARSLAADPAQQRMLERTQARLLVKSGRWRDAALLVDSMFARAPQPVTDTAYLGPAALTGRIRAAAELLRLHGGSPTYQLATPAGEAPATPAPLQQDAAMSFAYAIVGACVESLRDFPARVESRLGSYVADSAQQVAVRDALLRRPLSIAAPCMGTRPLLRISDGGDRVVAMEQALARGDTAAVRATYRIVMSNRQHDRPGDVAIDYTYLESWLLAAIGDTAAAVSHLDLTLNALPTLGPHILSMPSQSGALVRAMGLRAELAAARGDSTTAARWAEPVMLLWANADPELRPYVARMRALARAGPEQR